MTKLEELLIKYGLWTSNDNKMTSLIDSLENRSKNSLTFKQAIETVNEIGKLVIELENKNEELEKAYIQNIQTGARILAKYGKAIEGLQEEKKELCKKIHDLRENK